MVGALQIFGRRISPGDKIRLGKYEGKVVEINLLETKIEEVDGKITRLPHLLGLVNATKVWRRAEEVEVWLCAAPEADPKEVRDVLVEATSHEKEVRITLERLDRDGALFRIRVSSTTLARGELLLLLAQALRGRKIPLGRLPPRCEDP
ncbi:MAG: mechanosensitive ion channel family protein [Myxococcales bacterium]|nr:mechanosensitive ion channel family protein [Polyangiaceae bacterium]MDW8250973.1 mechanosensitive ion channel family protein [Myxococcales bacterium]